MGQPYIEFGLGHEWRRDGWWTVQGYKYLPPAEEKDLPIRLYNLEQDETEQLNLANRPEHQSLIESLLARVKYYASKESGWVPSQPNMPKLKGNPRRHNWTWAPFVHEVSADMNDEEGQEQDMDLLV